MNTDFAYEAAFNTILEIAKDYDKKLTKIERKGGLLVPNMEKVLAAEEKETKNAVAKVREVIQKLPIDNMAFLLLSFGCMAQKSILREKLSKDYINMLQRQIDRYERKERLDPIFKRISMSAAARAKHEKTPQQKAKKEVHNFWLDWQQNAPDRYPSASAFARDMLDKFPDDLSSQMTIQKWATRWKQELAEPDRAAEIRKTNYSKKYQGNEIQSGTGGLLGLGPNHLKSPQRQSKKPK